MLQASAHKNGIGANGIVPAQPGAVNGTVGGVRAANAKKGGEGVEKAEEEEAEGEAAVTLPPDLTKDGPIVASSLAETVSVREARNPRKGKDKERGKGRGRKEIDGAVPMVLVNGEEDDELDEGGEEEDSDDDEHDDENGRPAKRQKLQEPPAPPAPTSYTPLQQRPVGGGWGGPRVSPPAPTSGTNAYPLTPVTSGGEDDSTAKGKGPASRKNNDTSKVGGRTDGQTERLAILAPPGWGGAPRVYDRRMSIDAAEQDEDDGEDGEGERDGDALRKLRESSNLRTGGWGRKG